MAERRGGTQKPVVDAAAPSLSSVGNPILAIIAAREGRKTKPKSVKKPTQ